MESKREQFRMITIPQQLPNLPEEIITEILSRLSVKSLLKFRCISKSWCSLISSKHFIKTHLENSTKNTTLAHHRIISTFMQPLWRLKHCSLHSLKKFFLWNPSTRKSKNLPDFDARLMHIKHGFITKFGFGFDESSGDYKVYAVFSLIWIDCRYQAIGKVYSLKADSWENIKSFKDGSPFDEGGKFASGKLHWSKNSGLNSRWDICSFDLKSEVYGVVEQPSYAEGGFYPNLDALGCLCVLCDYPKTSADVWVLKQYGVKESWDKVVTVPYLGDPWQGPFSTPFCIGPKGEILFIFGSTFVIYYPKDNCFQHPQIVNFDAFHEADVYIESLVSLVPDGGEQEKANPETIEWNVKIKS
ncbi:hypothetical protein Pfo_015702 [Paulownia fortunei]|nr:hypothetical protein Pfo_015702 [Paulownia fortunei]